jgi:hypothetical protein
MAASGWRANVTRLPDPNAATKLATLTFEAESPSVETCALSAAILDRQSDRRPTGTACVPDAFGLRFAKLAAGFGASVRKATDSTRPTLSLLLTTSTDDGVARLRAGEAMSGIILDATRLGLATAVDTESVSTESSRSRRPCGWQHPQALLTIGWPSRADPLPATPSDAVMAAVRLTSAGKLPLR